VDRARQEAAAGETIDGETFIAELNRIISSLRSLEDMSVSERLRLIEELWASLAEKPDALGVPQWHREELDARLDAHRSDPGAAFDWADAKTGLQRNPRG
jgi:putative addiction module component (TIGR02574 family)